MTTSAPSAPGNSPPPTSSAGASPARTSARLAAELASRVRALGSGSSTPESFASYGPSGWSSRTSQLCLLEESTPFSGTWPRAGTMRHGIASQLPPLAPLTAVTGSSWSRGEYPTPSATDYGSSQSEGQVAHKRPTAGTPSLSSWARTWPTPTAKLGDEKRGSPSPETATARLETGRRNLDDTVVAIWATPTAALEKSGPSPPRDRPKGNLVHQAQVERWPTATASDADRSGHRGPKSHGGLSLTDATCRSGRPLPATCTHGGKCRPMLNPRFVAWLMSFPPNWIGPEDAGDARR